MSHYESHRITAASFLPKLPFLLRNQVSLLRGLLMAKIKNETKPLGIGLLVEKAAKKNPKGVAVYFEDTQVNYEDFNAWANRIADYYAAKGLKKGDVAIVFIENRPELLITVAALSKLGVISAMVNTSQTGRVLEHSVNLVKPKVAIVGEELVAPFDACFDQFDLKREDCFFIAENGIHQSGSTPQGYTNLMEAAKDRASSNPASSKQIFLKDPAFYIYTSGTTGMPKASVFNHGRFVRAVGAFGYSAMMQKPHDVMYVPLPFYHSTAMAVCWGGVLAGAAAVVMRRKFSASAFWDDCKKYNATGFGYVGELCRYLYDQPLSPKDRDHKVYKIVGNGFRPVIWKEFKERFGIERVYEFYASSEGNVGFVNTFNFDYTVGYTTVNYAIVKYDVETEQPVRGDDGFLVEVEKHQPGLLIGEISEKTPFDGYTDPEKTKKTIIEDVFVKGDRWFNSGDVMRDIGCKHTQFVDRLGDTFRWKGENVSTNEVESIVHDFPQIEDCVAYGVEIPNTNGRAGMAALTLKCNEDEFDFAAFFAFAKQEMPTYAVPVFLRIRKGKIDTTGSFKYKKSDLKDEAYYPDKCQESVYALLPGEQIYSKVDVQMVEGIDGGNYRF